MASSHLKRKVAPKTWPIVRKSTAFLTRPKPKGQTLDRTLPVVLVLRELLGLVQTAAQARTVLRTTEIKVNGARVYDVDSGVGFMDIVEAAGVKHRLTLNRNNVLQLIPVGAKEEFTIQKVRGVTSMKGGKRQLGCEGGFTTILDAAFTVKPGDSVQIGLDGKLGARYVLAPGAAVLVTGGLHIGAIGNIETIAGETVTVAVDGATFQTRKYNVYVVGDKKPAITLN